MQALHSQTVLSSRPQPPELMELALVEAKLQEVLGKAHGIIRDNCLALLNSGGKRIRPLLTVTSAMCFGPLNNHTIMAATASELIHMASLIHDDIIDGAFTRRGTDTINSLYGDKTAVLTGDYIFAEAFGILSTHNLVSVMGYMVDAIQAMCDGEVNQAADLFSVHTDVDSYFQRIAKKTGILLSACCKSGAASAGASLIQITFLGEYGLNLGYAYQIIDDILDFSGDQDSLGKPSGLDLASGNVTLPVILLMADPKYGEWLKDMINGHQITATALKTIHNALYTTGCMEQAYDIATQCIATAKSNLESIPAGYPKTTLLELADTILTRKA